MNDPELCPRQAAASSVTQRFDDLDWRFLFEQLSFGVSKSGERGNVVFALWAINAPRWQGTRQLFYLGSGVCGRAVQLTLAPIFAK